MKGYCTIDFEYREDVTSIVKFHREFLPLVRILHTKFENACDLISMLMINNAIAFHGIKEKQRIRPGGRSRGKQQALFANFAALMRKKSPCEGERAFDCHMLFPVKG